VLFDIVKMEPIAGATHTTTSTPASKFLKTALIARPKHWI
jgi:hypothetical protein